MLTQREKLDRSLIRRGWRPIVKENSHRDISEDDAYRLRKTVVQMACDSRTKSKQLYEIAQGKFAKSKLGGRS